MESAACPSLNTFFGLEADPYSVTLTWTSRVQTRRSGHLTVAIKAAVAKLAAGLTTPARGLVEPLLLAAHGDEAKELAIDHSGQHSARR